MAETKAVAALSPIPCVACDSKNIWSAVWIEKEGIWPSDLGHELVYSHIVLYQCLDCASAQIERYSHDCYPRDEPWDAWDWYALSPLDAPSLGHLIMKLCPEPLNPACDCPIHIALRSECHQLPHSIWPDPTSGPKLPKRAAPQVHSIAVDLAGSLPKLSPTCAAHHPADIGPVI